MVVHHVDKPKVIPSDVGEHITRNLLAETCM